MTIDTKVTIYTGQNKDYLTTKEEDLTRIIRKLLTVKICRQ